MSLPLELSPALYPAARRGAIAKTFARLHRACYAPGMSDVTHLEEQIAHLTRSVDDLSDVVARQETQIAMLTRRLALLMEREAARELDAGGTVPLADQRPPHW